MKRLFSAVVDVLALTGCGLIVYGVSLLSIPAALIVAGVFCLILPVASLVTSPQKVNKK